MGALGSVAQVVETQFGPVEGSMNGPVYQFLGIPFAKPPTGELRWKAPEHPDRWMEPLAATAFAPVCPQKRYEQGDTTATLLGDEDCLHLNIWTPRLGSGDKPVMVFIHGGGNQQGGASEMAGGTPIYFGKNLAQRGDVVVVTIQYRLGPLGFLVHPGLEPENPGHTAGNYAVLDQIMALQWIRNNASLFGGDTSKVMVFGESAGGLNTANLLTSPLAAGLFQRACIQSAAPLLDNYDESKAKGIAYVGNFINAGTDAQKIAYMRSLPDDSLLYSATSPLSGGVIQLNWQPVIDQVVFTGPPLTVVQSGLFNKVPLMIGSNSEEMSLSAPATVFPSMVTALINLTVPPAYQPQALLLYPAGSDQAAARQSYVGMLTDAQFTSSVRRTARCIADNQPAPVWRYFFTFRHTFPPLVPLGSYHGMELFYVFNNWENTTLGSGALFQPADDSMQQVLLSYWVNFAKTGDPNGQGLVNWPRYHSATDCFLELRATPDGTGCGIRTAQSDLWDDVAGFTGCTSSFVEEEAAEETTLWYYPNPADGTVTIEPPADGADFEVVVINAFGQRCYTTRNERLIHLSGQRKGVYWLEVRTKETVRRGKIIKR